MCEDVAVELEDVRLELELGGVLHLPHGAHDHARPREARAARAGRGRTLGVVRGGGRGAGGGGAGAGYDGE